MSTIVGYLVGQVGQLSGARFAIPEGGLIIGRDPNHADVVVEHSLVSRRHARIAPAKDGKLYLIDLQSRNGTHVNGRKLTAPVALAAGDKLDFGGEGQAVFVYESADTTSVSRMLKEAFGETVAPVEWKPGDLIGQKLEVRATLGKGGFGVVYLVYDRETREMRALKTIRRELLADGDARDAFKREALLWVSLDEHPFIVTARWVGEFYGRLFVLMDFVAPDKQHRVSLSDHLVEASGPLDAGQALEWAIQFCFGMEHAVAHGIKCHHDIKPANILITQDGTLRISDFGLASAAEVAWRASKGIVDSMVTSSQDDGFGFSVLQADGEVRCGTPGYMPPEVYRGETADIRSDIYSFGLVLWQMATGSRIPPFLVPYRGDIAAFLREVYERQMTGRPPRIGGPLWSVVRRCLKAKPTRRYSDFGELRDDLAAIFRKRTGTVVRVPQIGERSATFWNSKGGSLHALGRDEEAVCCCDKALAIEPQYTVAWSNKGASLDNLGRTEEAIVCFDKALEIDPRHTYAWNGKGACLISLNRCEEAISSYDKALEIDPRYVMAWNNKGAALHVLGRAKDAIGCYDKALAIDPRHAMAWSNKGRTLHCLGRSEEAIGCCEMALAIGPQYADAWNTKGLALRALGRSEDAIGCYDKALAINPRYVDAWINKGACLNDALGRHEEAIGCYDKVLAINPQHSRVWHNKGGALYGLRRWEDAIACYDKALSLDPQYANAWYSRALAEEATGKLSAAVRSYRRFTESPPPKYPWAGYANQIAHARQRLNELDK
jgi:tetratricopeptide (TPR) repeat protein/pSer/pThr/pTyr-binding forkhead associated (FHA) protein